MARERVEQKQIELTLRGAVLELSRQYQLTPFELIDLLAQNMSYFSKGLQFSNEVKQELEASKG